MKTVAQVITQLQKLNPDLPILRFDTTRGLEEIDCIETESFMKDDFEIISGDDRVLDGTYAIIR
jgi:hypothetical protein